MKRIKANQIHQQYKMCIIDFEKNQEWYPKWLTSLFVLRVGRDEFNETNFIDIVIILQIILKKIRKRFAKKLATLPSLLGF